MTPSASTSTQRRLDVLVADTLVGHLRFTHDDRREHAAFEYAADWLADPRRYAIDPTLPLVGGPQFAPHAKQAEDSRFHGAIADTEPDGWARRVIRRDHAKQRQAARERGEATAPVLTALDFLLAVDDHARVGALRFRDESGVCQRALEPGRRSAPPLLELADLFRATRAVENRTETLADLEYLRGRGTSLGGMRPKCSVRDDAWGLCLGKFPSVADERAYTKGEVLALQLARRAGIDAAEARLVDSDGVPVALIRRFDRMRDHDSGGERRLLYVSAATLMGLPPGDSGEHAYTEIADVIRQRSADASADLEELWRRVAFSILINNVDDHLHNHGFLHVEGGLWRLSPAFDLNPFPDRARELKTWISDDAGPAASVEALVETAPYFGLSKARVATVLGDVERSVVVWRAVATDLGFSDEEAEGFADAFEHDDRAVVRRLMA
ncbi:MAG: type II toxin-antitoxin system HipA family toxin [Gemmatimonadaceae bacterium]